MKKLLTIFIIMFSSYTIAEPYLAVGYQNTHVDSEYDNISENDQVVDITFGGLNLNPQSNFYLIPSWEVSVGFGEDTLNELHNTSYRETAIANLSGNFPIDDEFYVKVGVGMLWRNVSLANGDKDEEERIFNLRSGIGYRVYKNLTIGINYDSATGSPSFQFGYIFSGDFK